MIPLVVVILAAGVAPGERTRRSVVAAGCLEGSWPNGRGGGRDRRRLDGRRGSQLLRARARQPCRRIRCRATRGRTRTPGSGSNRGRGVASTLACRGSELLWTKRRRGPRAARPARAGRSGAVALPPPRRSAWLRRPVRASGAGRPWWTSEYAFRPSLRDHRRTGDQAQRRSLKHGTGRWQPWRPASSPPLPLSGSAAHPSLIAQGPWKSRETHLRCYQQPDDAAMLNVGLNGRRPSQKKS
jgi:hypothetical protein